MSQAETTDQQPALKRVMGPGLLLLFVVGDILGTGVYALTGDVAAEVGGAAWVPFLVAFLIATITAFSYLELVTKYPQAAGAALYAHKAFGIQFVTFLIAFVVMCSGITSASTAARTFAANFFKGFDFSLGTAGVVALALFFMTALALVNLRGVGESVKLNVFLTIIEISGLLLVILVGLWAFTGGADVDFSRVVAFDTAEDKNAFMAVTAATSLAFFAMVGFEDSVNMAEETKDPVRIFPKMLLTGLGIAGIVYVLVSIVAVALVPVGELEASDTPLVEVVKAGAPRPADRQHPAVHHDVRGVQHGADQHADGQQADLRHGPPARTAAGARTGASAHPQPVGRHHLHHVHRLRPDHLRDRFRQRQSDQLARRNDIAVVACGVRRRQRRGAGVAPRRARGRRAFQDPDHHAGHRVYHVSVPGDATVRSAGAAVRACGHSRSSSASCCSSSPWR